MCTYQYKPEVANYPFYIINRYYVWLLDTLPVAKKHTRSSFVVCTAIYLFIFTNKYSPKTNNRKFHSYFVKMHTRHKHETSFMKKKEHTLKSPFDPFTCPSIHQIT